MLPPMYTLFFFNTRDLRCLYIATSNTPQRGSALLFSTSENDTLYMLPIYTTDRFTDQGPPRAVSNFPLHQNTRPSRLTQQPDPPSQAGQSTDMTQYYCYPDDNTIVSLRTIVTWLTLNKAVMVTGVLQILLCTCTLFSLSSPHKGIATCMNKESRTSLTLTIKSSYIALIVSCQPQPLTTATSNR